MNETREIVIECKNTNCLYLEDGECQLRNIIKINEMGLYTSMDYD